MLSVSKDELYKNNSLTYNVISSDESAVEIIDDKIVKTGDGDATITYEVVENGVLYTAKTEVTGIPVPDYYADLSAYSMGFEDGGSISLTIPSKGYPIVRESEAITNNTETIQIVQNPKGAGKVMKLDIIATSAGDNSTISLTTSKNTSDIWAGTSKAAGTIPAGGTITYTFRYYWAQEMSAINNPAFCIYHSTGGVFATGSDFKTEAGKWHTAVLTYTNTSSEPINVGSIQLRMCAANNPAKTWTVAGHSGYVQNGTSDFGDRTIYIDSIKATIE